MDHGTVNMCDTLEKVSESYINAPTDFYEPSEVGEGRVDVSLAKIVCIARIASPTKEIMTGSTCPLHTNNEC